MMLLCRKEVYITVFIQINTNRYMKELMKQHV